MTNDMGGIVFVAGLLSKNVVMVMRAGHVGQAADHVKQGAGHVG